MASIRLDLCRIRDVVDLEKDLPRQAAIQLRKAAIYQHRNQCLSALLNTPIADADIVKTEYGKPYLKENDHFHFNHSHSQYFYVLATSQRISNMGVDVEELTRQVRFDALAQHAFHPNELQHWQESQYDPSYWFKVWTTKEAVLKASGLGIRLNLKELDTHVHPTHAGGMCQHEKIGSFAYQNLQVGEVVISVAWAAEASCKGFNFPEIKLYSSLTDHHIAESVQELRG